MSPIQPNQNSNGYFEKLEKLILIFQWMVKYSKIMELTLKKKKYSELIWFMKPDIKIVLIKTMWHHWNTNRKWNGTEIQEIVSFHI